MSFATPATGAATVEGVDDSGLLVSGEVVAS